MATLDERFRTGPPTRGPEDRHAWLAAEEKRFILWALREQWSAARIGRALGVHEATVRRFRQSFWAAPEVLLELGLFEHSGRTGTESFRCLVCGLPVQGQRVTERHVLAHFVEAELVDGVIPAENPESSAGDTLQRQRRRGN